MSLLTMERNRSSDVTRKPRTSRRLRDSRIGVISAQVALALIVLGGWQLGSSTGALDPFFFSSPDAILDQAAVWFGSGFIWPHLSATLVATAAGFIIGGLSGLIAGVLLGRLPWLYAVADPYLKMLNALPRLLLAPLFLLWFGLGIWSKVALAVTLVFFIVFFNTLEGIRSVPAVLVNNARMLGAGRARLLRTVYLPSALSWIFSSLHVSVGFAIIGAVIGEYLGASHGIGYLIAQAQGTLDTTGVFAGMLVLMIMVGFIELGITGAERRLLRWQPHNQPKDMP